MAGGKSPKVKGNAYERELVKQAKAVGLEAQRSRGSDGRAIGECQECDLRIEHLRVQAKRHGKLPKWMQLPAGVDAVATREDGGESVMIITWSMFLEMMKKWR